MEETLRHPSPASHPATAAESSALAVGAILSKRRTNPATCQQPAAPKPSVIKVPRSLCYTFIPYPAQLAEMERQGALPPAQLKVLALRRFADPLTGCWPTSTKEVAQLIGADRSTAQKALRHLEKAQYLHLRHRRSRTVDLIVYFGGFLDPKHRKEDLPPLKWDAEGTTSTTPAAHRRSQNNASWHSGRDADQGLTKPGPDGFPQPESTAPRVENKRNISIRNKEQFSTGAAHDPTLLPVKTYVPSTHDEAEVQELARKLGEKYMNSFLFLRRTNGLSRLKRACAYAQDKMLDREHPLKGRPGAYVRWLLATGQC